MCHHSFYKVYVESNFVYSYANAHLLFMILNFINKKADNCSRLFMLLNNLVHCLLIVKIFTFNVLVWFFLHYLGLAWIYLFNFSSACYPLGGSMFFGKLLPIMGIYVQECYARNMSRIRLGQPFPWANFWESLSPPFLPQGAAKNCLHAKVSWKGCTYVLKRANLAFWQVSAVSWKSRV